MQDPIEQFEINGKIVKIYQDENAESPREWDNLGIMAYWHKKYKLGDIRPDCSIKSYFRIKENSDLILSLYVYDHGGITMNTRGFSCSWDSDQVGYIHVSKERIRQEYGWICLTKKRKEKILDILRQEVAVFDQYLRGDVYGYTVETKDKCSICGSDNSEVLDSCYGFYGFDIVIEKAKLAAGDEK